MTNYTFDNLEKLIRAKDSNRLVIFVGAGVSMNSGIPSWDKLIESLSEKIDLKNTKLDPLKIAQLYYNKRKHRAYYDFIKEELKHGQAVYNPINEQVLKLKPAHIVTTNYDDLFEQVLLKNRGLYSIIRQNDDLPKSTFSKYLIKMHGCFSLENIVLKEDDYLNYTRNFALIESFIKGIFASKIVLFIGFSFDDINLKYILERVNIILGSGKQQHFIYFNESKSQIEYEYLELKGLQPIFFDDIKIESEEIKDNDFFYQNEPGQNLLKFITLLDTFDYQRYKIEKLPILDQIEETLSQFNDIDFLMPQVFDGLYPFNIKEKDSDDIHVSYYNRSPSQLDFNNNKILDLLKWTIKPDEKRPSVQVYEKINSVDKLREANGFFDNNRIKQITKGCIKSIEDYQRLQQFLERLNYTFIYLISKFNADVIQNHDDCNCIKCSFEKYDLRRVVEILKNRDYLKADYPKDSDFVKSYLIKGYFANKLGFRKIAYDSFKKAANESFTLRRESIRFLSSYNLKKINFWSFKKWKEYKFFREEQKKINLEEILDSLETPTVVKAELLKVSTESYISDIDELIRDIKKELEIKRDLHQRGGGSSGGNFLNTNNISGFRLIRFYESNFILGSNYSLQQVAETTFESCLISHTIVKRGNKKKDIYWPDDDILFELEGYQLHLFIHYSISEWHKKEIRKILGTRKIKLSQQASTDILSEFTNFLVSFFTFDSDNEIVQADQVNKISSGFTFKVFGNFLELFCLSDIAVSLLTQLGPNIINFLSVVQFKDWQEFNQLTEFLKKKGYIFTSDQLRQLCEIFIRKEIPHYIRELVHHIKDDVVLQVTLEDLAFFFKKHISMYDKALGYIYKYVQPDVQSKIQVHLENQFSKSFDSITFLQLFDYDCFDKKKLIAEYISIEKHVLKEPYPAGNPVPINNFLRFISQNFTNPNIKKLAKEPNKNTYIDWLLNFDTFDYQYFKLDWFQYFITQLFIKFMKQNQDVKKQLRDFLLINKEAELQNQYSRLYLENFETIY